jgi:hypothetical protein
VSESTLAPPPSARDGQLRSAFTVVLENLVRSCRGGLGAGLVDEEGESVDVASLPVVSDGKWEPSLAAYHIKLSAAHWQIVMRLSGDRERIPMRQLWVKAEQMAWVAVSMYEGYVLVYICRPHALGGVSQRALRQCQVELCQEALWPVPEPDRRGWVRVGVRLGEGGQPREASVRGIWQALAIVGAETELTGFERGFRVKTEDGRELSLVREPSGFWFAGAPLEQLYGASGLGPAGYITV